MEYGHGNSGNKEWVSLVRHFVWCIILNYCLKYFEFDTFFYKLVWEKIENQI